MESKEGLVNLAELVEVIRSEGERRIESFKKCPSYLNYCANVDMIGEEEDFATHRTIDLEHRRFHGELKRTAQVNGMEAMLRTIVVYLTELKERESKFEEPEGRGIRIPLTEASWHRILDKLRSGIPEAQELARHIQHKLDEARHGS